MNLIEEFQKISEVKDKDERERLRLEWFKKTKLDARNQDSLKPFLRRATYDSLTDMSVEIRRSDLEQMDKWNESHPIPHK